jgi:hypothetical protein
LILASSRIASERDGIGFDQASSTGSRRHV